MNFISRYSILMLLVVGLTAESFAQEMTKDEWQKQITELTAQRNSLRSKLAALQSEIDVLKKQDADKATAVRECQDELLAMVGATRESEAAFVATLDKIDAKLNELSRLSNQELWARKGELDGVQTTINDAKKNKLSLIPEHSDRLQAQQGRLDALKRTLASLQMDMTYTVGTWAKDRDCLWNIAKKPKIYDNAFLWPKIWQGNRDQIKNPDIIQPGQKLKIPPKAPLTKEEKAAASSYWKKKAAMGATQ